MSEVYDQAGKGLWFLFLSAILSLAAAIVGFIPLLGDLVGLVLMVAAFALNILGPYVARDSHPFFRYAFYASIAAAVLDVLGEVVPDEGLLSGLVNLAASLAGLALVYFICTAAGDLLREKGDETLANRADLLWKLQAGCTVVVFASLLVAWIPVLNVLAALAALVVAIVAIVVGIMQVIFYYNAAGSLRGR